MMVELSSLFCGLGMVLGASLAAAEDDKAAAIRFLSDYYRAFSTLDLQVILPYFLEPSLLVSTAGVAATTTHAALAEVLTPAFEGLRAKGYTRSELTKLQVKKLSANTALASGVAVRYKAGGRELEQVGVMYVLQKTDAGWKIAVLVSHDADNLPRLE
jgi:ketosteroid isomerase-like protein